jgi:signal transduction histidine kinase
LFSIVAYLDNHLKKSNLVTRHTLNQDSAAELRHSLCTPLNHIIGNGEMLLEELDGAGPMQDSGKVRDGLLRLIGKCCCLL